MKYFFHRADISRLLLDMAIDRTCPFCKNNILPKSLDSNTGEQPKYYFRTFSGAL